MPPYFKFMTLMAFRVFLEEGVDVAVVEVGLGGTYDATNMIPKPSVVGITSLGKSSSYEHSIDWGNFP